MILVARARIKGTLSGNVEYLYTEILLCNREVGGTLRYTVFIV